MDLDRLILDFKKKFPKIDYFTEKEIIQYMRMSYCVGYEVRRCEFAKKGKPVVRSDGKEYDTMALAARKNDVSETSIRRALRNGTLLAGYYWRENTKGRRNYIKTHVKPILWNR